MSTTSRIADAFVTDKTILDKFLKTDPNFQVIDGTLAPEPIAIGIRKNDSQWRDALNGFIQDMVADGTWEKVVKTYVSIPLPSPELIP